MTSDRRIFPDSAVGQSLSCHSLSDAAWNLPRVAELLRSSFLSRLVKLAKCFKLQYSIFESLGLR